MKAFNFKLKTLLKLRQAFKEKALFNYGKAVHEAEEMQHWERLCMCCFERRVVVRAQIGALEPDHIHFLLDLVPRAVDRL